MPTINGVPNYPQKVESRAPASTDAPVKKPEQLPPPKPASDDAVVTEIKAREPERIPTEEEAVAVAQATADKIRKQPAQAVEAQQVRKPDEVQTLLS